jgi:NitT/TauT family transport system substrate-binding protein
MLRTDNVRRNVFWFLIVLWATALPVYAQKLVFTPNWTAQAQFAGFYVALEKGFYRQVGLDVEIVHPSVSEPVMSRIMNQKCQVTLLMLPQAMEIIDKGVPLVNILQTSMNNALMIISRRGKNPLSQKGARMGTWHAGSGQLGICMSRKENLDYEWVHYASNMNLFVAGALDGTLAMSYNEYYQLLQAGMPLDDETVYRFCDHGYNIQDDGVYMTKSYYKRHREQARRFADATRKGWEWAASHSEETIDIVMKYVKANRVGTNRVLQELMLKEILRLQIDRESKKREFRLRPDMVERASRLMYEQGFLEHEVKYEELIAR